MSSPNFFGLMGYYYFYNHGATLRARRAPLLRWNYLLLEHYTSVSSNLMKPVMLKHSNVFAARRIISKQIRRHSTEQSFISTWDKTILAKTDISVQITALRSVGVRVTKKWDDKYLALGDWKRFHYLSLLQRSAATYNSSSSIVTYIHSFLRHSFSAFH